MSSGVRGTLVRPAVPGGAGNRMTLFDALGYVDSANPNTVFKSNGSTPFTAKSNSIFTANTVLGTNSVWGSLSKIVHHLASPLRLPNGNKALFALQNLGGSSPVVNAKNVQGGPLNMSASVGLAVRLSIVTADFDPAALTWNTYGGLTTVAGPKSELYGASVNAVTIPDQGTLGLSALGGGNGSIVIPYPANADRTIYGIVLEAGYYYQVNATLPGAAITITSTSLTDFQQSAVSILKAFANANAAFNFALY